MKTIIEMAQSAGFSRTGRMVGYVALPEEIARFAELVTEQANARANNSWTRMCEKMVEAEREACAKVCEAQVETGAHLRCAAAIRARSNT